MVIESSQQPVKRGRGRPRKNPLPEEKVVHKHVEKNKHVEKAVAKKPQKTQHDSSLSWEEELAAFERRSNKSGILTLLVLLLGIALIGYGMYLKLHQADVEKSLENEQTATVHTPTTTPTQPKKSEEKEQPIAPQSTDNIINTYFSRVNNGQFDSVAQLQDSSFTSLGTLRTYFSKNRLDTFSKNTIGGIRVDAISENKNDPVVQRNPSAKVYDFRMVYTLKSDEKEYREPWKAYVLNKGTGTTVINGFVYQGTGTSQSPFFQWSKFGIK